MKAQKLEQGKIYKIFDRHKYSAAEKRDESKFVFAVYDGIFKNTRRCVYVFIDDKKVYRYFFSSELKTDVIEVSECDNTQIKRGR